MTEDTAQEKILSPQPGKYDLSEEIEQSMERLPDERCKVVRVSDNFYRCNWWVKDKTPQLLWLSSGSIRKSRFLRATKTSQGLLIDDVTID